ncbi:MAG: dihydrodipicolinate synthase family protein [Alphaproteobacteria bacterium]|nr:dihydrodipicolinate synthase family protein [Alphaproteobacteria bacterium]
MGRHAAAVLVDGIVGVMCNGHAGENYLTTREEKRRVTRAVVDAIGKRAIVVCGINAEGSLEAAEHARDAEADGADAVMIFAPNAWALGQDETMALRHHRMIVEATRLPLMLFQASVGSGRMAYSPEILAQLLALPRVVGIKEGSWEVNAYERTLRIAKRVAPTVAVMGSGDEHLFTSFMIGSEGSVVSLAAVIPEAIVALDRAVKAGDVARARALHEKIHPLANLIYGVPPGARATARLKACLQMLGRFTSDAVRPPFAPIDAAERARIEPTLRAAMTSV